MEVSEMQALEIKFGRLMVQLSALVSELDAAGYNVNIRQNGGKQTTLIASLERKYCND